MGTSSRALVGSQPELAIVDELVSVEPGQSARTTLRIRNVSNRVVHYSLSAVPTSPAAPWISIAPDSLRLLESESGEAEILIQPPRDASTSSGRFPFAIMADPGPDGEVLPAVAESDVAVGAIYALDARLVSSRAGGRLRGRLRVDFTNRGNADVRVAVTATDDADDEKLHFAVADGRVTVPANGSAAAYIKLRPDRPMLIGKPVVHPFIVRYRRRAHRTAQLSGPAVADEADAEITGSWTQRPIIAKWMIVVAIVLIAVAGLLIALRRASAGEAVPRAPRVPELTEAEAANGMVQLTFEVADAVSTIEVQLVEPPVDDQYDLAKQTGEVIATDVSGSTTVVSAPLGEKDGLVDGSVYFRYRAVAANESVSIWRGDSEVISDSLVFAPPANVRIAWLGADEVEVRWEAPENPEERTLRYALRRDDRTALDVVPEGTTARVTVGPEPFGIQVQVLDADATTALSDWSAAVFPPEPRPSPTAFSAPGDVHVTWVDDLHVKVAWTSPTDRGDRTLQWEFRDELGNEITEDSISANTAIVPMGEPVVGIEVRALNKDDPAEVSPWSTAVLPEGDRPPPPTTTTTTIPGPQTLAGFYVLPQAAVRPTEGEMSEWPILWQVDPPLHGALEVISSAEYELPEFVRGEFLIASGYVTQADAVADCEQFLSRLDAASTGNPIQNCWVLEGPRLVEEVPAPASSTAPTTTAG